MSRQRVALVQAASQGLGRASAEALARDGYALLLCARHHVPLDDTARALRDIGATVDTIVADVARADDIEALFARLDETYGRLDAVVCNAGGPPRGTFADIDDSAWQTTFELTFLSVVRTVRASVARMHGAGRIVIIGSSSIRQPIDALVLSNAFRPALNGLVKSLAQELGPLGITINMAAPGAIATRRVEERLEERSRASGRDLADLRDEMASRIPLGRIGDPAEFGSLVAYLCSPGAAYMTGQAVVVDGGAVSALP